MDMIDKHFIEFCDHIFPIEDVQCIEKFYTWSGDENSKKWSSRLYLNVKDRSFSFPQEKYDEIKKILLEFRNNYKEQIYETGKK